MPRFARLAPAAVVLAACSPDRSAAPTAPVAARAVAASDTSLAVVQPRDLGSPPGYSFITVTDINERGQIVGDGFLRPGAGGVGPLHRRAFLWQDDGVVNISGLADTARVQRLAHAVDDAGVAVGEEISATGGGPRAVVFRNGGVEYLAIDPRAGIGSSTGRGLGTNAAGDAAGEAYFLLASRNAVVVQAAVWRGGTGRTGAPTPLGALMPGGSSVAHAVNNRGRAVGASRSPSGRDYAVLFDQGRVVDLGTLPGHTRSVALGINDRGQVVGYSTANDTTPEAVAKFQRAVLWEDRRAIDIGALAGGGLSIAFHINEAGDIVGSAAAGGVVWHRGVAHPLPALRPGVGATAAAINDRRQVAGTSGGRVVRWTLGPAEPADPTPNAPPVPAGLRPEPASGAFSVGAKACYGRYTACVRFSVADPDAGDAPFRASIDWGDGSRWAPNAVPRTGVTLLAPHDYAAPGTYTVRVTVADRRGRASTEALTVRVAP